MTTTIESKAFQAISKELERERQRCRELEIEIMALRAEIEALKKELSDIAPEIVNDGVKIFEQNGLIEQMREALSVLVASATQSGPLWHGSAEMQIAKAALEAAERMKKK